MSRLLGNEYALIAKVASARSEDPPAGRGLRPAQRSLRSRRRLQRRTPGVEIDWSNRDERRARVIHAEANAFRYLRPQGYLLAATPFPVGVAFNSLPHGIENIYADEYEKDDMAHNLCAEFGIELVKITPD